MLDRPLRIAQVAPPLERVPPPGYGGTERVVHELVEALHRRGHAVTTFASGDSDVSGRLVPTVPEALRPAGFQGDPSPWFLSTVLQVLERAAEFDVIHSHVEWYSAIIATVAPVPVVTTWHDRLDYPFARQMLTAGANHQVAISAAQAATHPDVPWTAVIHNGLTLDAAPVTATRGDALAFVGRFAPEKGVADALEIARLSGRRIRLALKDAYLPAERAYRDDVILPMIRDMGVDAEYLGELAGADRDRLFAESFATLMPGAWPEPFGLVAIESLACGTPVLARRIGGLAEILREGIDGFFGDDAAQLAFHVGHVEALDRQAIRRSVLERFSATRMGDDYERLYRQLVDGRSGVRRQPAVAVGPGRPDAQPARPAIRFDPPLQGAAWRSVAGRSVSRPRRSSTEVASRARPDRALDPGDPRDATN